MTRAFSPRDIPPDSSGPRHPAVARQPNRANAQARNPNGPLDTGKRYHSDQPRRDDGWRLDPLASAQDAAKPPTGAFHVSAGRLRGGEPLPLRRVDRTQHPSALAAAAQCTNNSKRIDLSIDRRGRRHHHRWPRWTRCPRPRFAPDGRIHKKVKLIHSVSIFLAVSRPLAPTGTYYRYGQVAGESLFIEGVCVPKPGGTSALERSIAARPCRNLPLTNAGPIIRLRGARGPASPASTFPSRARRPASAVRTFNAPNSA
jgi:hypothetical protein